MSTISKELQQCDLILAVAPAAKMADACTKAEKDFSKSQCWIFEPRKSDDGKTIVARPCDGKAGSLEFFSGNSHAEMAVARILLEQQPRVVLFFDVNGIAGDGLSSLRFVHNVSSRLLSKNAKGVFVFSEEDSGEALVKDAGLFCDKTIRL